MGNERAQVSLDQLAHLCAIIQRHSLDGRLTWHEADENVHLFFRHGTIVHAQVDPHGQIGEDGLDWLLTRRSGQLFWTPAGEHYQPSSSLTDDMALNFERLLLIMVEGDLLARPDESDADLSFFGLEPAADPVEDEPAEPAPARLWLPPGEHHEALSQALESHPYSQHRSLLQQAGFSGYVYYQPAGVGEVMLLGLLVVESGLATAAYASDVLSNQAWTDADALAQLARQSGRAEAFQTAPRLLAAYRAILHEHGRTPSQPLSKAGLQAGIASFRQGRQTGAIGLWSDPAGPLFLLFEGGQPIGLVGGGGSANSLAMLPQTHPLPLNEPDAQLQILQTPPVANLDRVAADQLPPQAYQLLTAACNALVTLGANIVGPEAIGRVLHSTLTEGIQRRILPATWRNLLTGSVTNPLLDWTTPDLRLGDARRVIAGFEFLLNCVYRELNEMVGTAFLPMLIRAWDPYLPELRQSGVRLPFDSGDQAALPALAVTGQPDLPARHVNDAGGAFLASEDENPYAF